MIYLKRKVMSTKDMVITALLIAFGIIIPTAFGFLRIVAGPFTATLTAHVPIFVAMFLSPASAVFTAIGTTIGFLVAGVDIVVTMRAASHIIFAIVGAYMIKKGRSVILTGIVAAILHALSEIAVVLIFFAFGWTAPQENILRVAFYITGIGTILHHTVDYAIAVVLFKALEKTKAVKSLSKLI